MRESYQTELDWVLLGRVFAGEATAEEHAVLRRWTLADPAREALVARLRETWRVTGTLQEPPDIEAALVEIGSRIDRPRRVSRPVGVTWQRSRGWQPWAWAAAVLLCIGLGAYAVNGMRIAPWGPMTGRPVPMVETATTHGQRASIRLADGSRVILGVASRIRYARDFGMGGREVELEGEAYFDVVHDARVPFRVRTTHGVTEDIGTKFAVRSYTGESMSRVVVEEGKVTVAPHVILGAGDVARVAVGALPIVEHHMPVGRLLSWTQGYLEFVNTPVPDALADLQRWYGIEVRVTDGALARRTITASFQDVPMRDVLNFIVKVLDARLERHGAVSVLVPNASAGSVGTSRVVSPSTGQ